MKRRIRLVFVVLCMFTILFGNQMLANAANKELSSSTVAQYFLSKVGTSVPQASCLAFIADGFADLGATRSSANCAWEYGNSHISSTSMDNIPIGADVFFNWNSNYNGTWYTCGDHYCHHIGVYVGDGYVVHTSSGKVVKTELSKLVTSWNLDFRGWGIHGNVLLNGDSSTGGSTAAYTITNRDYKDLTDTSVTLQAKLDKSTTNMSECGVFLGTSTSNMTQIKETVSIGTTVQYMSYGTAKWYGTLTPGTTYYYQFYAIIGGTTYWGDIGSFTTTSAYTITNRDYAELTETSVTLKAKLDKSTTNMSQCGMYIGTSTSNMTQIAENVSVGTTVQYMSYGTAKWYGTLNPGTTYYYQFYAIINGATYWGPVGSFTTNGSAPDTQAPVISNVQVKNVTENGYTVSCTVTDNVGVNRVQFPTWKASESSEGCTWYPGTQNGNTWTFTYTDAAVEGEYLTHIYAYDNAGNYAYYAVPSVYVRKTPEIPEDSFGQDAVYRIYGTDRYQTSYKIADALKAQLGVQKFQTAIIASGQDFPDALAGSYLAGKKNAPILMINEKHADTTTAYIRANVESGGKIYILGGEGAVPSSLLRNLEGYQLRRLSGATRYETNLRILEEADIENQEILICTGQDFADSLSASATGRPILLVNKKLSAEQKAFLSEHSRNRYYIIGGTAAVSAKLEGEIQQYVPTQRISGARRFETSVKIAEKFFNNPKVSVLAYAYNYPDGLCGGSLAMSKNAPIILTATGKQDVASDYMAAHNIDAGAVLGGDSLISNAAVMEIYSVSTITIW